MPNRGAGLGITVLVVDDEAIARSFMERALTQEGFQVILASDGEEALQLLRTTKGRIALIIPDLVMRGRGAPPSAVGVGKLQAPPPLLYISAYEKPTGE